MATLALRFPISFWGRAFFVLFSSIRSNSFRFRCCAFFRLYILVLRFDSSPNSFGVVE